MLDRWWDVEMVWRSIREIERTQEGLHRIFNRVAAPDEFPVFNVWAGEEDLVVKAELPGVRPEELEVSVVGDTLTLRGARVRRVLQDGEVLRRQERAEGPFARTLRLPFAVEVPRVSAQLCHGALSITLPRAEADRPRKIAVTSASHDTRDRRDDRWTRR